MSLNSGCGGGVRCVVGCYHFAVKDQVRKGLDYIIIALQKLIANETPAGTEMLLYMAASTPKTLGKIQTQKNRKILVFSCSGFHVGLLSCLNHAHRDLELSQPFHSLCHWRNNLLTPVRATVTSHLPF